MARLRQANRVMALVVIGVAALWLTPLLNAERLSARDQVAPIASGTVAVADADLWFLGRELGVAGTRALADLAKIDLPDGDRLAARIAAPDAAASRYLFEQEGARERAAGDLAELIRIVPVRPDGAAELTKADFARVDPPQLARWLRACRRQEAVAGCVLMRADLLPDTPGDEALFLWDSPGGLRMLGLHAGTARPPLLLGGAGSGLPADAVDLVLRGEVSVGIPALRSVSLGDAKIVLLP